MGVRAALSPDDAQYLARQSLLATADLHQVIAAWLQRGIGLESIYLDGITQAARTLGQWWLSDEIDFGTVTVPKSISSDNHH